MWWFSPVPGKRYMVEFKAKSASNLSLTVEAFQQTPATNNRPNDLFQQTFNIGTGVNTYKLTLPTAFTTMNNNYYLAFWLALLNNGQSLWLDDIKLYQYNEITTVENNEIEKSRVFIRRYQNNIIIETPCSGIASVFSLSGQLIKQVKFSSGTNKISIGKGFYIIHVTDEKMVNKTTKILI